MSLKVLVVEDEEDKSKDIVEFLESQMGVSLKSINVQKSLRSGLHTVLRDKKFDFIILDMSMPNFDPTNDDPVGTPESFAGQELLKQMSLRKIRIPVVVLTQYTTFAKGAVTIEELDRLSKNSYDFFLGSVFYSSADSSWKRKVQNLVGGVLSE